MIGTWNRFLFWFGNDSWRLYWTTLKRHYAVGSIHAQPLFHFGHHLAGLDAECPGYLEEHFQVGIFFAAFQHADVRGSHAEFFTQLLLRQIVTMPQLPEHRGESVNIFLHAMTNSILRSKRI